MKRLQKEKTNRKTMNNKNATRLFLSFLTGIVLVGAFGESAVKAHGGRLNASGCHNNKKLGTYHCHQSAPSQQQKRDSNIRIEKESSGNKSGNSRMIIEVSPSSKKSGTVVIDSCYDGDTCTTTEGEKIRLACIDTPELRGSRADPIPAKEARDFLNDLVAGRRVSIRRITTDRYGRTVAELSVDGVNVQQLMVVNGLASIYERYADPCPWAQ